MKITSILDASVLRDQASDIRYCILLVDRKTRAVFKVCNDVPYKVDGGVRTAPQPVIVSNIEQAESETRHYDEAQYEAYLAVVIFPKFLTAMPEAVSLIGSGEQTK